MFRSDWLAFFHLFFGVLQQEKADWEIIFKNI